MRWIVLCLGIFGYLGAGASTSARDLGQWEKTVIPRSSSGIRP